MYRRQQPVSTGTTTTTTAGSTQSVSSSTETADPNLVKAGPSTGTLGTATYRALVDADLPIVGASHGGAGTTNGIMKANGSGVVSAATSGTDYAPGTSALATGILKSTTTTGALSAASGADVAALIAGQNVALGTVTSPSVDPGNAPASHNYVAWTAQPERVTSATTQNAGVAQAMKVWVPKSIRITGLSVYLNANMTATASNINGLAVYSSAGTLLAYTDDQASAWSDAGNLTKIVNAAITKDPAGGAISYLDVTGGAGVFVYFVLVSSTSGTKPSFGYIATVNGAMANAGLSTGLSCGYKASTTSWPTTPGGLTLTASGLIFWIGAY